MKAYPEDAEVLLAVDAERLEPRVADHIVTFGVPPEQVRILHTVWNRCTQSRKKVALCQAYLMLLVEARLRVAVITSCLPVCWDH